MAKRTKTAFSDDRLVKIKWLSIGLLFGALGATVIAVTNANPNLPGDVNDDNVVNISDLSILLSNWGKRYTPGPGPNPNPNPNPGPTPQPGQQTLGVGGVATPAGAILATGDTTSKLTITSGGTAGNPKVYDGKGHKVGLVEIKADHVVVQNYRVCSNALDGFNTMGNDHVTIQNNDIKCIKGPGDLNGVEFYGNNLKFMYNTFEDWVIGDPGDSHTDCFQTWNNDPGESSSNVLIKGNRCTGPKYVEGSGKYWIRQCVMAQGAEGRDDGGSGGTGDSSNWLITENYFFDDWNQCIKLDDIDNSHVTRNTFAGESKRVIEITENTENTKYWSDNIVTGNYGQVGATITQGAGPTSLPGL